MNATRHVVIAMTFTLLLFVIAGDQWNARLAKLQPVKPAPKV